MSESEQPYRPAIRQGDPLEDGMEEDDDELKAVEIIAGSLR